MYSITIITEGDSHSQRTWSNIPYFLTTTLENKGYIVNRVNVNQNVLIMKILNKVINGVVRKFYNKQSTYTFNKSKFFSFLVNIRMRFAVWKYPKTDVFISTSFKYCPYRYTKKPTVLLHDWPSDYNYKYLLKREPDKLEKKEIEIQREAMGYANYVITLFPDVEEYLKKECKANNIYYLGNVINTEEDILIEKIMNKKLSSNKILFIGSVKYKEGLKTLIQAFGPLKEKYPELELHVIGMKESDLPINVNYKDIYFYGYLDKSISEQKDLYNKLISESKVYVNTTPNWAAFSAVIEAMHYCNPIITTPTSNFIKTFGEKINFGFYSKNNQFALYQILEDIFKMSKEEYYDICLNANEAVKEFSWDNYVDRILDLIFSS